MGLKAGDRKKCGAFYIQNTQRKIRIRGNFFTINTVKRNIIMLVLQYTLCNLDNLNII